MGRLAIVIAAAILVTRAVSSAQTTEPAATTNSTPTTRPTTSPVTRRANAAEGQRVLQAAVGALTREIESALRNGTDAPRMQSDYFQEHSAADISPAALVATLRRASSSDPRVAAYVKWQLLSGLPIELDPKLAAELLQAYRAAPEPLPRPGIEKQDRDDLDRLVRNAKEDDEERVTELLDQKAKAVERDNMHVLKDRDALFAKLPPSYDVIGGGFEDTAARLDAGVDANEHTRAVCKAASAWAATSPPAEQMKSMVRAIAQVQKKKGREFYSKVYVSKSSGRLQWSKSQESLSRVAQLGELQAALEDRIKNPATPLKLKDDR